MSLYPEITDLPAEESVLSTILSNPGLVWSAAGLKPEHFASPLNGRIFTAIQQTAQQGRDFDPLTINRLLAGDRDMMAEDGPGESYIFDLASSIGVGRAGLLAEHCKTLADLHHRRALVTAAEKLRNDALTINGTTPEEMRAEFETTLADIRTDADETMTGRQVLQRAAARMAVRAPSISTGMTCLDEAMGGGIYPHRTYAFQAMNKAGKTALLSTISYNLNVRGHRHAYLAAEMGSDQISMRMVARSTGIPNMKFLTRPREMYRHVMEAAASNPDNIVWSDMPGASFPTLRARVSSILRREKIEGFILDGWQLIGGREKSKSLEEHLREVAQWCADFANKHGIWCIISAQINDDGFGFGSRRGLEMACDQVYVLHRDPDGQNAWMEQRATRYTPRLNVGSELHRPLFFNDIGPYFEDFLTKPNTQAAMAFDQEADREYP